MIVFVRLSQGTAIRESMLPTHETDPGSGSGSGSGSNVRSSMEGGKQTVRDESILLRICSSSDRTMAAKAVPGTGTDT